MTSRGAGRDIGRAVLVAAVVLLGVVGSPQVALGGLIGVARPDAYSTAYQTTLNVPAPGVLANDFDLSDPTAQLASPASHGSVVLRSDGSFVYVPDASFSGTDTFTYRAKDSLIGLLAPTAVTLTVSQPDPTPAPTPTPTPSATPSATPTHTPAPTPVSIVPVPSLPLPSLPRPSLPLPSIGIPGITPAPSAAPTPTPTPTASPTASPTGLPGGSDSSAGLPGPGLGTGGTGTGAGGAGAGTGLNVPGSTTTGLGGGIDVAVDLGLPLTLLVPTMAFAVPGILLMLLVILSQGLGALAWIPFVRRSLGDFGVRLRSHRQTA